MTVRAHYSQGRVVLDEPGTFAEGAELLVTQVGTAGPEVAVSLPRGEALGLVQRLAREQGVGPVHNLKSLRAELGGPDPDPEEPDMFELLMSLRAERRRLLRFDDAE